MRQAPYLADCYSHFDRPNTQARSRGFTAMTQQRGNDGGGTNQGAAVDTSNRVPVSQAPSPLRAAMATTSSDGVNTSPADTRNRVPVPQAPSPLRATVATASSTEANTASVDASNRVPVPQAPGTVTVTVNAT